MLKKYSARILVLDDDAFMLRLLNRILNHLGYTSITTCDNGPAALKLLGQADSIPELILLDLNMPGMDGVEFVHELVERHYAGSLILVSGEDPRVLQMAQKMVQEHKIPLLGRLSKPVAPEVLEEMLEKWAAPAQAGLRIYDAGEVRNAIANGELVNYYQPKVEVATGQVIGMETLVRWNHPQDGLVLPAQFVGVAEMHGLVNSLTAMVLDNALSEARSWKNMGLTLQLAVNISMDNLMSPDFADSAAQLAIKAGIPPGQVMLELRETRLAREELRTPLETLTRLRLKRFRLSIDNFCTGHSPLSRLRDIPFDELKIDRSILLGLGTDSSLRAKYDTTLSMSRTLGMASVVMGVETLDDWNLLRRTGCDYAQGNFIAPPMPAADLPAWRGDWVRRVSSNYR